MGCVPGDKPIAELVSINGTPTTATLTIYDPAVDCDITTTMGSSLNCTLGFFYFVSGTLPITTNGTLYTFRVYEDLS